MIRIWVIASVAVVFFLFIFLWKHYCWDEIKGFIINLTKIVGTIAVCAFLCWIFRKHITWYITLAIELLVLFFELYVFKEGLLRRLFLTIKNKVLDIHADRIRKHKKQQFNLMKAAAAAGNPEAQCYIAEIYWSGEGLPLPDHDAALNLYRKAAQQGYAPAQNTISIILSGGKIRHNYYTNHAEAVYWMQKSAGQGNAEGQRLLGYAYKNGEGVHQDMNKAYYWLNEAALQGDKYAKRGLKEIEEWRKKNYLK